MRAIIICVLCLCSGLSSLWADGVTLLTGEKLEGKVEVVEEKVALTISGRTISLPRAALSEESQSRLFPDQMVIKTNTELPPYHPKVALQPMDSTSLILSRGLSPASRMGRNEWAIFAPHLPGDPAAHKGRYPLIILIHGGGERATDIPEVQFMNGFSAQIQPFWQSKYGPTFLMHGIIYLPPILPSVTVPSEEAKMLHANIQDALKRFPEIDSGRIYLISMSLGSRLLMEYVLRSGVPAAGVIHADAVRRPEFISPLAEATKGNFRPPIGFHFGPGDSLASPEKIEASTKWLSANGFPESIVLPLPINKHVFLNWSSADDKLWRWLLSFRHPKPFQYDNIPELSNPAGPLKP